MMNTCKPPPKRGAADVDDGDDGDDSDRHGHARPVRKHVALTAAQVPQDIVN